LNCQYSILETVVLHSVNLCTLTTTALLLLTCLTYLPVIIELPIFLQVIQAFKKGEDLTFKTVFCGYRL
jgi:hypothetical protein